MQASTNWVHKHPVSGGQGEHEKKTEQHSGSGRRYMCSRRTKSCGRRGFSMSSRIRHSSKKLLLLARARNLLVAPFCSWRLLEPPSSLRFWLSVLCILVRETGKANPAPRRKAARRSQPQRPRNLPRSQPRSQPQSQHSSNPRRPRGKPQNCRPRRTRAQFGAQPNPRQRLLLSRKRKRTKAARRKSPRSYLVPLRGAQPSLRPRKPRQTHEKIHFQTNSMHPVCHPKSIPVG